jgi:uncharacterized HAD superfamily protein
MSIRGLRIGVDVDGVLADFNQAYVRRTISVTGKDLFPGKYGEFEITTWNYPESYGYTHAEVSAVWRDIKADGYFWQGLGYYDTTHRDIQELAFAHQTHGDDVYFITARPGVLAKLQTETWLTTRKKMATHQSLPATVLISSKKGLAAQTLDLDVYVDDRWENCLEVAQTKTKTYLFNRGWNLEYDAAQYGIIRVQSVADMLQLVQQHAYEFKR